MEIVLKLLWAFLIGGLLCVIAQVLIDRTKLTPARILVGFVVAGVILGAVGVYGPLAEFAGAGATTPLSGFGYLIAKGVRQAVDEKGAWGIFDVFAICLGVYLVNHFTCICNTWTCTKWCKGKHPGSTHK